MRDGENTSQLFFLQKVYLSINSFFYYFGLVNYQKKTRIILWEKLIITDLWHSILSFY